MLPQISRIVGDDRQFRIGLHPVFGNRVKTDIMIVSDYDWTVRWGTHSDQHEVFLKLSQFLANKFQIPYSSVDIVTWYDASESCSKVYLLAHLSGKNQTPTDQYISLYRSNQLDPPAPPKNIPNFIDI